MGTEIGKRLRWVQLVEQGKSCSQVCLQCGISPPTLRKWVERYRAAGTGGLLSKSRRPHRSPASKVSEQERAWIVELSKRGLGSRRIQSELKRGYDLELSRPTIEKVFQTLEPRPRPVRRFRRKGRKRYVKEIPGERVQMDTCKIAPGFYQYTAIDDCTRIRVLALYKRRSAANSLLFLEKVIEEFPFPIQRIQTDRGREFFAYTFHEKLMEYGIKFRPLKPASPHLNGKGGAVATHRFRGVLRNRGLCAEDLAQRLDDWQSHYNEFRVHGSLDGPTPWQVWYERARLTPLFEEVEALYDESVELIRHPDYRIDLQLATKHEFGSNRL